MSLMDTITRDLKASMKKQDKLRVSVLRMVLSEFKYAMTSGEKDEVLDDEAALQILTTYHKRLEKSLADFPDGEKKGQILKELVIVKAYLPQKAEMAEVQAAVDQLLEQKDIDRHFGSLMQTLMSQFGTKADGKVISQVLKERLKS